ncbi:MAG: MFS transporter [Planctomycetota bacterium]|nr:MFS transporter [Planctomycetota bacterium]
MLAVADVDLTIVREVMPYVGLLLVVVLARALRHAPANLLVLMLTAFVDMAGLFLIIPLLPFYVKLFHSNGETLFGMEIGVGFLTGLVVTSFTVAQLLTAPMWGRFSDRYGRRAAVAVALSASTVAYLLFGFADSLWMLLLSRVVQGAGGGLVGVIQAYVADSVEPAQRARALGWLSASTNLGVALGPFLGSCALELKDVDLWPGDAALVLGSAVPGVLAAGLCVVNAVFALRYLKETAARQPKDRKTAPILTAVRQVLAQPRRPASRVILVYALAIGTAHAINPLMALFLDDRMGVDDQSIGYVFMYIGSISVFARVLLLGRAVDRFGEVRVSRMGACSLAAFFLLMPFVHSLGSLALVLALQPIGMALTFPSLAALLSRLVPQSDRGMFMGIQQSFAGLVRVLAPLLYGNVFDLFSVSAPFWIAGGVVLTTLSLSAGLRRAPADG